MKKTFPKKGLREIWAHKFQYFFLILILALGIAAYGSFYNMSDARGKILDSLFQESNFMDLQAEFQYGQMENLSEVQRIIEDNGLADSVEKIEYRLSFDAFVNHTVDGETKTTRARIIGYAAFDEVGDPRLPSVNTPLFFTDYSVYFSEKGAMECYIEHKFSDAYGINEGDIITVVKSGQKFDLDILADVDVPEFFFVIPEGSLFPAERSLCVLVMPMSTAEELLTGTVSNDTLVNGMVMHLEPHVRVDDFRKKLEDAFQNSGILVKSTEKDENPSRNFLIQDYENDKENMMIFPMVIFMVSGFGLLIALRRMIRTHRVQIGIFKALGVPPGVVIRYFSFIGLAIAVFSIMLGWLMSIPIDSVFNNMLDSLYNFSIMKTSFSWFYFLVAGAISVAVCLGCTMIPAWRALRIKPVDAIQSKEGISVSKAGKLAGRIGRMGNLPVPLKLTLRNLVRRPRRTFSTVLGVALALGLFFAFAVSVESIVVLLDDTSSGNQWDYEITMDGFAPSATALDWKDQYDDIEKVNTGLMLPVTLMDAVENEEGLIYAVDDVSAAYSFDFTNGAYREGEVVISKMLAEQESVGIGDVVELAVPYRHSPVNYTRTTIELKISGIQSNHMGPLFFTDLDTISGHANLTGSTNLVYLMMEGDDKNLDLENGLITSQSVRSVTHSSDRKGLLDQYFDLFMQVMGVMGFISMLMAGAIVYNMFRINALESRREYATMKTLGTSQWRISKLIFMEGGFVTIFSILAGTAGGYGLAYYMMQAATDLGFDLPMVFSWLGFAATAAMITVVIVLVSLLTIRFIGKIVIADVIRERSS